MVVENTVTNKTFISLHFSTCILDETLFGEYWSCKFSQHRNLFFLCHVICKADPGYVLRKLKDDWLNVRTMTHARCFGSKIIRYFVMTS